MQHHLSGTHKLVLFLLIPALAFFDSLRDGYRKSSQYIIMLYCGLVGWLSDSYNEKFDLSWYIEQAKEQIVAGDSYYYMQLATFLSFGESTGKDFYFETMVFLVSQFTSNYHYVFLCIGLVYGFFYSKSYGIISKHIRDKHPINRYYGLLLFLFFIGLPVTSLCSVRFWTASWITIYVVLKIHLEKKYFSLLFLCLAVFVHGSFIIAVGLVLITLLIPRFPGATKYMTIAAMLSIPFSYLSLLFGDLAVDYAPVFIQKYVKGYFEGAKEGIEKPQGTGFSFVADFFGQVEYLFYFALMVILLYKRFNIRDGYQKIYLCMLVFLTFSNFLMTIPTVGGRFMTIARLLLLFIWCVTFTNNNYSNIVYKIPLVYSFNFVYWIYYELNGSTGYLGQLVPPVLSYFRFM